MDDLEFARTLRALCDEIGVCLSCPCGFHYATCGNCGCETGAEIDRSLLPRRAA